MLVQIEEFGKHVAIAGFKTAKIRSLDQLLEEMKNEKPKDVEVQLFDAALVATWQHLYLAALNALVSFRNRQNISNSLAMETMLYASAQHQIRKATTAVGIKPDTTEVAVLVMGDRPGTVEAMLAKLAKRIRGKMDDAVLDLTEEKVRGIKKTFRISDKELSAVSRESDHRKALADLVVERMALLSTER